MGEGGCVMPFTRKTISLQDKSIEMLQRLAEDCGMDVSQCVNQLILRHSGDIRKRFSLDVSDFNQTYSNPSTSDSDLRKFNQTYSDDSKGDSDLLESTAPIVPQYESTSVSTPNLEESPKPVSPCDAFLAMDF